MSPESRFYDLEVRTQIKVPREYLTRVSTNHRDASQIIVGQVN